MVQHIDLVQGVLAEGELAEGALAEGQLGVLGTEIYNMAYDS